MRSPNSKNVLAEVFNHSLPPDPTAPQSYSRKPILVGQQSPASASIFGTHGSGSSLNAVAFPLLYQREDVHLDSHISPKASGPDSREPVLACPKATSARARPRELALVPTFHPREHEVRYLTRIGVHMKQVTVSLDRFEMKLALELGEGDLCLGSVAPLFSSAYVGRQNQK